MRGCPSTKGVPDWIRRERLDVCGHVIAELTDEGWARLAKRGRDAFIADLRGSDRVQMSASSAKWRFVRRLPSSGNESGPLCPRWTQLDRSASNWRGEASITADLCVLDGHFPDEPIVPGVALLYWAESLARRVFPGHHATGEVVRLKFRRVVVPGTMLTLALENRGGTTVSFTYVSDKGVHSSGSLIRKP